MLHEDKELATIFIHTFFSSKQFLLQEELSQLSLQKEYSVLHDLVSMLFMKLHCFLQSKLEDALTKPIIRKDSTIIERNSNFFIFYLP